MVKRASPFSRAIVVDLKGSMWAITVSMWAVIDSVWAIIAIMCDIIVTVWAVT